MKFYVIVIVFLFSLMTANTYIVSLLLSIGKNETKRLNAWVIYFFILGLVQALWINLSASPPIYLRLAMIAMVFGPILFCRELVLFVIPFFMTLRGFLSTNCSYLPDVGSIWIYICIVLLTIGVHVKKLNFSFLLKARPLIYMLFFFALVDIIHTNSIGAYTTYIFLGLLLFPFMKKETDFHFLSASIMTISFLLSIYFMLLFDSFAEEYAKDTDVMVSGWIDPNYFAIVLCRGYLITILYLLDVIHCDGIVFHKYFLGLVSVVIFAATLMLGSRTGFLTLSIITIVGLSMSKLKIRHYLLIAAFFVFFLLYLYSIGIFDLVLYRMFEVDDVNSFGNRTPLWQRFRETFFVQDVQYVIFGGGYSHRMDLTGGKDLHNEFLSVLADYGVSGLLLFLAFIVSLFSFAKKRFWLLALPVFVYLLSAMSLSPFRSPYVQFFILWIYAMKTFGKKQKKPVLQLTTCSNTN